VLLVGGPVPAYNLVMLRRCTSAFGKKTRTCSPAYDLVMLRCCTSAFGRKARTCCLKLCLDAVPVLLVRKLAPAHLLTILLCLDPVPVLLVGRSYLLTILLCLDAVPVLLVRRPVPAYNLVMLRRCTSAFGRKARTCCLKLDPPMKGLVMMYNSTLSCNRVGLDWIGLD